MFAAAASTTCPGSSAVTFDPHRCAPAAGDAGDNQAVQGVSSVPSRGRAISVQPSPSSTAASNWKYDGAPWNDNRAPATPATPATPSATSQADPPWQVHKRRRIDGSVRAVSSDQTRPSWWGSWAPTYVAPRTPDIPPPAPHPSGPPTPEVPAGVKCVSTPLATPRLTTLVDLLEVVKEAVRAEQAEQSGA